MNKLVAAKASYARYIAPAVAVTLAFSTGAFAADGDLVAADYTGLATKILTYLGYAIAAGLTVLVAIIAAKKGYALFQQFIRG